MTATVLPFRRKDEETYRPNLRRRVYPPRRPRNGHYPDCPLATRVDAKFCRVCASETKGS